MLKLLKKELIPIFDEVVKELTNETDLTDRTLDDKVLNILKDKSVENDNIKMHFSEPMDEKYTSKGGRSPYDLLIYGTVNGIPFKIFLNNKFGKLNSNSKNDTTSYNNLLRLYLDISEQRLSDKITINKKTILNRIMGNEIVSYALFIVDKDSTNNYNFFFFEELNDEYYYVNPRNNYFQVEYNPKLNENPITYCEFVEKLIDATIVSLNKSIEKAKSEVYELNYIKSIIKEVVLNE